MTILVLTLLLIVFIVSVYCANTKYIIESTRYLHKKTFINNASAKLFILMLDFISRFFELSFVALLLYLFYIDFYFPVIIAFICTFFLTFLLIEVVLKMTVRLIYENENGFVQRENIIYKLTATHLFKTSFAILPLNIKDLVKENSRFSYFFETRRNTNLKDGNKVDEGVVEQDIIDKVFELGEQSVYEAMRPRTEIVGIDISDSIEDVHKTLIESGYSKLIVYEDNLDNIKGVVFAYDLFKTPADLKSILREIIFVPESKKSIEMLNLFLNNRISIAVVVDEFGGTAGIVTMEDIIEELFGEIKDEYDVEENICKKVSENTYVFSGKVEIDYINELFELNIPYGDYETIGGLIITHSGRIPIKGEIVKIGNFAFHIIRSSNVKIDLVKMIAASVYKPE